MRGSQGLSRPERVQYLFQVNLFKAEGAAALTWSSSQTTECLILSLWLSPSVELPLYQVEVFEYHCDVALDQWFTTYFPQSLPFLLPSQAETPSPPCYFPPHPIEAFNLYHFIRIIKCIVTNSYMPTPLDLYLDPPKPDSRSCEKRVGRGGQLISSSRLEMVV